MVKRFSWLTPDSIPSAVLNRRIAIPFNLDILDAVNGALSELTKAENWEQFGTVTPDEIAYAMQTMFWAYVNSGGVLLIGTVLPFVTAVAPENTLECDGSTYDREDYPVLYSVLDTAFIIDADSFMVPDMRARVAIGSNGAFPMGDSGGELEHTLTLGEIPTHSHGEITATASIAEAPVVPVPSAVPGIGSTGTAGGGSAHNNMQPYVALRYCIVAR